MGGLAEAERQGATPLCKLIDFDAMTHPTEAADFLRELRDRAMLHQTTGDDAVASHLASGPAGAGRIGYAGFDPTSTSLTIGNFIPIKLLMHWQQAGHTPIVLMGGGTGMIGDPSGKEAERQLRTREEIDANVRAQRLIFERFLDFDPRRPNAARIVNNADWLTSLGFIEVLRDVGKHFSVNQMMQRDSVRTRLEERDQGISYTEFSYMILQAYDFLHLYRTMGCTVQLAGSDQFGNIVSGIDLIRRDRSSTAGVESDSDAEAGSAAFGITAPLVTTSDGRKIGKTESGAVWLTADLTSPYRFYQYWLNTPDDDLPNFLRWFTFRVPPAIDDLMTQHTAAPHERAGQHALAEDMTRLVHGSDGLASAQRATNALFTGELVDLDEGSLRDIAADLPASQHDRASLGSGVALAELLPETTLASSRREAREFLSNGAVSVNGTKIAGDDAARHTVRTDDLLPGGFILLRRGRKKWHVTRWNG